MGRGAARARPEANIPASKRSNEAMPRGPKPVKQSSDAQATRKQGEQ